MMNLGKSLSVSESESDKYLLDFLKEEAMIGVYFSLILCSTTHRGVQLVLGISRGEMCDVDNEKSERRETVDGIELPNQEKKSEYWERKKITSI